MKEKYQRAWEILYPLVIEKFEGKYDKAGFPYITHLNSVRNNALKLFESKQLDFLNEDFNDYLKNQGSHEDYTLKIVILSLCHDLIEDTDVSKEDLIELKIPDYLVNCLDLLTKPNNCHPGSPKEDEYYEKIKQIPLARLVKIADLLNNMDLQRIINSIKPKDIKRTRNYLNRLEFLLE